MNVVSAVMRCLPRFRRPGRTAIRYARPAFGLRSVLMRLPSKVNVTRWMSRPVTVTLKFCVTQPVLPEIRAVPWGAQIVPPGGQAPVAACMVVAAACTPCFPAAAAPAAARTAVAASAGPEAAAEAG